MTVASSMTLWALSAWKSSGGAKPRLRLLRGGDEAPEAS
jgi:hypothetical protein